MRTYKIKNKKSGREVIISNQHFGWDRGVKRVRWHGIYLVKDGLYNIRDLEALDKLHKYCIKFPWCANFNKQIHERMQQQKPMP